MSVASGVLSSCHSSLLADVVWYMTVVHGYKSMDIRSRQSTVL